MQQLNGIDLFAGAGGLSEGFIQAGGFKIVATIEKDHWACETQKTRHIFHHLKAENQLEDYWEYCRNTSSVKLIEPNRQKIYAKHPELKEKIDHIVWKAEFGSPSEKHETCSAEKVIQHLKESLNYHNVSDIDFILGGPPCQVYSIIGRNQRKRMRIPVENDPRNFLFEFYCEIVKEFHPQFFLFENVPGITSAKCMDGHIFEMIQERFDKIDYFFVAGKDEKNIHRNIHNALYFGVPQIRKRFIFMGIKKGANLEYPSFDEPQINREEFYTKNVISDLPCLRPEDGEDHKLIKYKDEAHSFYQSMMREGSDGFMNHKARPLNKNYDKEIYKRAIQKAMKGEQLDYSKLPKSLKKHKNERSFTDRFKVHWWHEVPHTIVAHLAKDGHYNIHPDEKQLRSITVREAARIQSFLDNFRFEGPRTAQFIQVGNAVPPLMAKAFAEALKKERENV
jgi:DNA (cytosine-5)-methyltransferase 1